MAHLSAVPIVLGDEERRALEGLMRGHTTPQQMALRARMILHCDDGVGVREIARRLGVWPKTVRRWHKRWLSSAPGVAVAARLSDAPKSGAPAKFGAEQICAIIAIACEPPSASDRPITQWSQQEVADEAMRRGIVDSISQRSVGRFFKGAYKEGLTTGSNSAGAYACYLTGFLSRDTVRGCGNHPLLSSPSQGLCSWCLSLRSPRKFVHWRRLWA